MEAVEKFLSLNGYKDSEEQASQAREKQYSDAVNLLNKKQYMDAAKEFDALDDYKDSKDRINEAYDKQYDMAIEYFEQKKYLNAYDALDDLGDYKDASEIKQGFVFMPTIIVDKGMEDVEDIDEDSEAQEPLTDTITIKYDEQGRIISAKETVRTKVIDKYTVQYDKKSLKTMDHYEWSNKGKKQHPEHFKFVSDKTIDVDVKEYVLDKNGKDFYAKYIFKGDCLIQNENGAITEYIVRFNDEGYLKMLQRSKYEGKSMLDDSPRHTFNYDAYDNYTGVSDNTDVGGEMIYNSEIVGYTKNKKKVMQDNVRLLLFIEQIVPRWTW